MHNHLRTKHQQHTNSHHQKTKPPPPIITQPPSKQTQPYLTNIHNHLVLSIKLNKLTQHINNQPQEPPTRK